MMTEAQSKKIHGLIEQVSAATGKILEAGGARKINIVEEVSAQMLEKHSPGSWHEHAVAKITIEFAIE